MRVSESLMAYLELVQLISMFFLQFLFYRVEFLLLCNHSPCLLGIEVVLGQQSALKFNNSCNKSILFLLHQVIH